MERTRVVPRSNVPRAHRARACGECATGTSTTRRMNFATMVFIEGPASAEPAATACASTRTCCCPSTTTDRARPLAAGHQGLPHQAVRGSGGRLGAQRRLSQGRQGRQRGVPRHARRIGHDPGQRLHVPEPRRRRRHAAHRRAVQVRVRRQPRLRARALLCKRALCSNPNARPPRLSPVPSLLLLRRSRPSACSRWRTRCRRRPRRPRRPRRRLQGCPPFRPCRPDRRPTASSACARGRPHRTIRRPRGPTTAPTPSSTCTAASVPRAPAAATPPPPASARPSTSRSRSSPS